MLRSRRLDTLPLLGRWNRSVEFPKIALSRSRRHAGIHSIIHIMPLATAFSLIVINLRRTYIGNMTTTAITSTQFATKLLEAIMQASLATISLSIMREQVLTSTSLPLGAFLGPYRMKDISYLWSLDLWGALTTKHCRIDRRIILALLFPVTVILAAIIAPSNAILMIPRLTNTKLVILNEVTLEFPDRLELIDGYFM